jgi:hypothetical protein
MTEVKDILYSVIESIGREKIQADVIANINLSENYIRIIIAECITNLNVGSDPDNNEKAIASLGEALLHFMLTVCAIPSERKIPVGENLTADVIIPNLRGLKREPERSIIIQFIKDDTHLSNVSGLGFLQPNYENIWLIYVKPPLAPKYTTYSLLYNDAEFYNNNNYSNIIIDISRFLRETGDSSFKFIH